MSDGLSLFRNRFLIRNHSASAVPVPFRICINVPMKRELHFVWTSNNPTSPSVFAKNIAGKDKTKTSAVHTNRCTVVLIWRSASLVIGKIWQQLHNLDSKYICTEWTLCNAQSSSKYSSPASTLILLVRFHHASTADFAIVASYVLHVVHRALCYNCKRKTNKLHK